MIHKTAIVDKKAKISGNVLIGPYSIIGPDVQINEGAEINPMLISMETQLSAKIQKSFRLHQLEQILKI